MLPKGYRRSYVALLLATVLALVPLSAALASLCVWRNPDADIKTFFGGGNYRSQNRFTF